jgi:hypothetical protein
VGGGEQAGQLLRQRHPPAGRAAVGTFRLQHYFFYCIII